MARAPARITPPIFHGIWRISETELWDQEALDTVQPAFIRFDEECVGSIGMIVIQAGLDCRYSEREGKPLVEFTFEGDDDGHPCTGRGWAALEPDQKLRGRLYIHLGDDSEFVAERDADKREVRPKARSATRRAKPKRR